jgi:ABC-type dipeptide/oligopeptide/nickel transport system permease component
LPRLLAELSAGVLAVASVAYLSARIGLGNPFAGLGASQGLDPVTETVLRRIYGLDKPPLEGLLYFLSSLARGSTGPSLVYGKPALRIALDYLPWTLLGIASGFMLALLATVTWIIVIGPKVPRPIRSLSFIPGYFYAAILLLSAWWLGWPHPLPSHDAEKVSAYSLIVFMASWPRLLHALAGILSDPGAELKGYVSALRAMGASEHRVNKHLLRTVAAPFTAYMLMLLAMILERSAIIEPLIGYTGLGHLLYEAVVSADPILAATVFTTIGVISYTIVFLGRFLENILDPRMVRRT